ncbi:hypothetical protein EJ05DRAFT_490533 [Pseudovirgaria hyperparasitica]|uniref:Bacteriophage T5 Orf172 DNA-binding domain-containing protein n=1 Tax=Pseudovirgaria hyperparasitica TaxID=470096 RepID=A0A6A6VRW0_9PEZI|nr:uncharacterized protein EJ05DRAFT_490533 [Pseudovirgaria hyperparasitica]KAF2752933.1 hypothetical protein EJ05DRAFT_490533 [Pseudovirgaria hyperparasitica]
MFNGTLLTDPRCIAPVKGPKRCGGNISTNDLEESQKLGKVIETMGQDKRKSVLKDIILLHVCKNTHRQKLEEESECLGRLVQKYDASLLPELSGPKSLIKESIVTDPQLFIPRFGPCSSDLSNTVKEVLRKQINPNQAKSGTVYVFACPSAPGYVKIGYVKESIKKRMAKWNKCHPQASLLYEEAFAFPERMEKLIHLELASQRRCLLGCKSCGKDHIEWFQVSIEEVRRLIQDWKLITQESELYSRDGRLSSYWIERLAVSDLMTSNPVLAYFEDSAIFDTWQSPDSRKNEDILAESFAKLGLAG